jgi:hypothetical protein
MQKSNASNHYEDHGQFAAGCGSDPMHQMRVYDHCADRDFKCQSMSLNARCAKSVLRWISQSMKNDNRFAADKT